MVFDQASDWVVERWAIPHLLSGSPCRSCQDAEMQKKKKKRIPPRDVTENGSGSSGNEIDLRAKSAKGISASLRQVACLEWTNQLIWMAGIMTRDVLCVAHFVRTRSTMPRRVRCVLYPGRCLSNLGPNVFLLGACPCQDMVWSAAPPMNGNLGPTAMPPGLSRSAVPT